MTDTTSRLTLLLAACMLALRVRMPIFHRKSKATGEQARIMQLGGAELARAWARGMGNGALGHASMAQL